MATFKSSSFEYSSDGVSGSQSDGLATSASSVVRSSSRRSRRRGSGIRMERRTRREIGQQLVGPQLARFADIFNGRSACVNEILIVRCLSNSTVGVDLSRGALSNSSDDDAGAAHAGHGVDAGEDEIIEYEEGQLPPEHILGAGNFSSIFVAADPDEALRVLRITTFDLLVADVHNGGEPALIQMLQTADRLSIDMPRVLCLTWERSVSRLEDLYAAGCCEYIQKPFPLAALCQRIRSMAPTDMLLNDSAGSASSGRSMTRSLSGKIGTTVARMKNASLRWRLGLLESERKKAAVLARENTALLKKVDQSFETPLQAVLERIEAVRSSASAADAQRQLQNLIVEVVSGELYQPRLEPDDSDESCETKTEPTPAAAAGVSPSSSGTDMATLSSSSLVAHSGSAHGLSSGSAPVPATAAAAGGGASLTAGGTVSSPSLASRGPRGRVISRLNSHSRWVLEEFSSLASSSRSLVSAKSDRQLLAKHSSLQQLDFSCFDRTADEAAELVVAMFTELELLREFKIEVATLRAFLTTVRTLYPDNPYHNFRHAIDVTQAVFYFLTAGRLADVISRLDMLCLLIAALGHDLNHPGRNNQFLVATSAPLALVYNDQSVLENHHAAVLAKILEGDSTNLLAGLDPAQRLSARETIITCILATDMARHFELLSKLQVVLTKPAPDFEHKEERKLLLGVLLHSADISNAIRPLPVFRKWAERVQSEYGSQADAEVEAGLPVTEIMRRDSSLPALEVNFIRYIVRPLFTVITGVAPTLKDEVMSNLDANYKYFEKLLQFEELAKTPAV